MAVQIHNDNEISTINEVVGRSKHNIRANLSFEGLSKFSPQRNQILMLNIGGKQIYSNT